MNIQVVSPRVRFTCRIIRYCSALTSRAPAGHIAGCTDCQAFFRAAESLETEMRREAAASVPVISASLERRILQATKTSAAERPVRSEPREAAAPRWWVGVLAGGALAAATVALLWPGRATGPHGGAATVAARDEAAVVASAVQTLSAQFVESVLPTTGELVANNPLQQEAESIYADARSALGFLAMNFLPPSPEPPRRSG